MNIDALLRNAACIYIGLSNPLRVSPSTSLMSIGMKEHTIVLMRIAIGIAGHS
jgi:hypothetical protein